MEEISIGMKDILCFDHRTYLAVSVNPCVVHDENGVLGRKWVHVVQKTLEKFYESFSCK
jgi:hypothetical protein